MSEILEVIEKEYNLKKEYLNKEIKCLDLGFVRLVDFLGTDDSIVQAARVSYGKGTKTINDDKALIRYLIRNKHTSPLEMTVFKFHMKLPIFTARQFIRHRTFSTSEYSLRYSEAKNEFYLPEHLYEQNKNNKQGSGERLENELELLNIMDDSQEELYRDYERLLESGVSREIARINLPVSIFTEWYWKADLHNLFHFFNLRLNNHSQKEAQIYAQAMYDLIKPVVPVSCEAFEDYILNAKTFSAKEMKILKRIIDSEIFIHCNEKDFEGLSKREIIEFKEKLKFDVDM